MAYIFAPPLASGQGAQTSEPGRSYPKSRKRKRTHLDLSDSDENDTHFTDGHSISGRSSAQSTISAFTTLSADVAKQYRTAGHDPDENDVPATPFPHKALPDNDEISGPRDVTNALANLNPPFFVVQDPSYSTHNVGQKQRHLEQMTSIMHHCLLIGDYQRAGKAWGMILRTQVLGRGIDVRVQDRWGIGAEILLHTTKSADEQGSGTSSLFSEEGFRAARDYYERLILQYPIRHTHPNSTNSRAFYPAMFGLWIYEICEYGKRVRKYTNSQNRVSSPEHDIGSHDALESGSDTFLADSVYRRKLERHRSEELKRAQEVSARMDELMTSPPHDRNPDLLQLRGMVALWIGDLYLTDGIPTGSKSSAAESESELFSDISSTGGNSLKDAQKMKESEVNRAVEFFRRVQENGGRLWSGIDFVVEGANLPS
ncbi:hypothetical protein M501DRAFT_997218 [Patellaria atrata CBS 101060]|uniref:Transcription factor domain-containing protein n=1 Tax=Patellaria atrata CBS 101060 TaxID=1346257 RepID=A0A9P4S663_9PEZI|nr:hypothetical protein M501DRAFT_997218 [Patellaria atrata CBS 101060]